MQAQTMEQLRYHWPLVGGPHPVWTVCWPETRTVAGTKLLGNVFFCLVHKGKQLYIHEEVERSIIDISVI